MTKSGKHHGKRRNCTFCAILSFVTMFIKSHLLQRRPKAFIWGERVNNNNILIYLDFLYLCHNNLSHVMGIWFMLESINPFPHTKILQQTTLNIFCRKMENVYNWMDNLWLKVENIVAKWEIAHFVQIFLLSICY